MTGPMCAQKKERNEMTGHEGGEDISKGEGSVCEGERMKREPDGRAGNQ